MMEEALYIRTLPEAGRSDWADLDYGELYKSYGSMLYRMKKYEDATKAFEAARFWNPINVENLLDCAEGWRKIYKINKAKERINSALMYAYTRKDIARGYRALGRIYTEEGDYKSAICFMRESFEFEPSGMVMAELNDIIRKSGNGYAPAKDEIKKCIKDLILIYMVLQYMFQ